MFLLKFYCKMFLYLDVPGSSGPPNRFLGVVDFGRPGTTAQESGTGLGTMETISKSLSSSGVTGDAGAVVVPSSWSIRL